ncbi:GNAT family N-acetyltransferase [Nocardioides speluncae]|uniref:GNAT family N-acetyltransferase n=1 Tax=Nocardioides speluncae TaxID=2670337 RepID=UPI000D69FE15|nr:GNAT family protein [Nocardioides speluncae]
MPTPALHDLTWPVKTERLLLRPATSADLDAVARYRGKDGVSEWLPTSEPELFRERYDKPETLAKFLVAEADGVVIADLMIAIEDAWAQTEVAGQAERVQAEIGWAIDPEYGGRGLATEAVREMLRICFDELGLRRVAANTFAGNEPSWRLMERIGMRREQHTIADSLHRTHGWSDGLMYALLAEEWRARQD